MEQMAFKVIGWELIKCCAEFAASVDFKKDYLKFYYLTICGIRPTKKWFNEGLKIGFEKWLSFLITRISLLRFQIS